VFYLQPRPAEATTSFSPLQQTLRERGPTEQIAHARTHRDSLNFLGLTDIHRRYVAVVHTPTQSGIASGTPTYIRIHAPLKVKKKRRRVSRILSHRQNGCLGVGVTVGVCQ